jgi:hypothetical protein
MYCCNRLCAHLFTFAAPHPPVFYAHLSDTFQYCGLSKQVQASAKAAGEKTPSNDVDRRRLRSQRLQGM